MNNEIVIIDNENIGSCMFNSQLELDSNENINTCTVFMELPNDKNLSVRFTKSLFKGEEIIISNVNVTSQNNSHSKRVLDFCEKPNPKLLTNDDFGAKYFTSNYQFLSRPAATLEANIGYDFMSNNNEKLLTVTCD